MKKTRSKFIRLLILAIVMVSVFLHAIPVYGLNIGSGENRKIQIDIKSDKAEYNDWDSFEFSIDYKILGELGSIKEGEEISFNVPEEFKNVDINYPVEHFKQMKKSGDKVTLVFGQNAHNAVGGYIRAKGRVTSASSTKNTKIVVELNSEKIVESTYVTIKPIPPVVINPIPSGGGDDNNHTQIIDRLLLKDIDDHIGFDSNGNILSALTGKAIGKTKKYRIYINEKYTTVYGARLIDNMPSGMELITNSLKISRIDLNGESTDETKSFSKYADRSMLDISFGNVNSKYIVEYEARFTEERYRYINTAELINSKGSIKSTVIINRNFDETNLVSKDAYNLKQITNGEGKTIKVASVNDKVPYCVYINRDKLYIENVVFEDFIPEGMKYVEDSLSIGQYDDKENFTWVTEKLKNKIKIQDGKITVDFGNTEYKYVFDYKLEIVDIKKSYENRAKVSYGNRSKEASQTVQYEVNSGAINGEKLIDKTEIKHGENSKVMYTIAFDSFGFFEKNYLVVADSLDKRVKILKVDVPEHFSANIDYVNNIVRVVNDKKDVEYGEKLKINIYADLSGVEDGSTVSNIAKINKINTNEVKTKKGYAFIGKKVDFNDKNKVLQGAKFLLKDSSNKVVKELTSGKDGIVKSEIKDPGKYFLEEIEAPKGYEILKDSIVFEIKDGDIGTTIDIGNIKNEIKKGTILIKKVDENSIQTSLPGAEFDILNSNGVKVNAVTTKNNGEAVLSLIPGKYKLVETKAPKGYILNKTPINFEIEFNQKKRKELLVKNIKSQEVVQPTWEEVKPIDTTKPAEGKATETKEKDLEKATSEKPVTTVGETEVVDPTWEEVKPIDTTKPAEGKATETKEKDLEKATSEKPVTTVGETEVVDPSWEEVKPIDTTKPVEGKATETKEKDLEKATSEKPVTTVGETEVVDPTWEEVKPIDPTKPAEGTATETKEKDLEKATSEKPVTAVGETEVVDPSWEEVKPIDPTKPAEGTATETKEKDLEKATSEKPVTTVGETEVVDPTWEEVKPIDPTKPTEGAATETKEKDLEKATSEKPVTTVGETDVVDPTWEEVKPLDTTKPKEEKAISTKEDALETAVSEKPQIFVGEDVLEETTWEETDEFETINPSVEIATETIEPQKPEDKEFVDTKKKVKEDNNHREVKQPKTGDNSINGYLLVLIASILGLAFVRKK